MTPKREEPIETVWPTEVEGFQVTSNALILFTPEGIFRIDDVRRVYLFARGRGVQDGWDDALRSVGEAAVS